MADDRERSKRFWFEFDNVFNPRFGHVPIDVKAAYAALDPEGLFGIDYPYQRWRTNRDKGTYPDGFRTEMTHIRDPLIVLSAKQAELLDRAFTSDADAERTAFEHFGQGVLFNNDRPPGQKIHHMDNGGPDDPPHGYYTWHGIIRAAVMVGADPDRWLRIDRNVGLAWAIHAEARAVIDSPNNPGLSAARLAELRSTWQAFSFDELDVAFDSEDWPPGHDRRATGQRAPSDYDQLRSPRRAKSDEHQSE
jgi:hypothetical protein